MQRVSSAKVASEGVWVGEIATGLLVYLGVAAGDAEPDADYIARKIAGLRVFRDAEGKMNLSLAQVAGSVLLVSQFTLLGDVRKGNRPAFDGAAPAELARHWYEAVAERLRSLGIQVATGRFQTHMEVSSTNDGPITILLDSRKLF